MNKETMMVVALLFSTALGGKPNAYSADWVNEHDEIPDLALGTSNDWWLRVSDTGGLYIQARDTSLDSEYRADIAQKMLDVTYSLIDNCVVAVALPWSARDLADAKRRLRQSEKSN